nr:allene oxide synthase 3-like isoform X2 [Coffea arabica]XP_027112366.1 allene oxide synthase 3-like isoform X2 [Coffea arabica]
MSSSSSNHSSSSKPNPSSKKTLPLRDIPGGYGLPFFGPIKDRRDYYYNQGTDEFFKSRMQKYNSTVFRTNVPPGPFMAKNPKVVAVLDAVSFPILFDNSKVEKKNVLDGTFMPSTDFTGGYRVCAFLDTREPSHAAVKGFFSSQLAKLHNKFIPTFRSSVSELFANLEGFSAYGGTKVLFPALIKWVGAAGEDLHRQLAHEIRTVVKEEGGVTVSALNKMSLTKSVVYEALRIEPPVPFQYGKAREDVVISSHDSSFLIEKGEMIFGYQPFATKDPKVFDNPEEFVGDRFLGDGERLLKYVYWSNGRETDNPTVDDKQCPGKDLVVLLSKLLLVEFFLRYDTFSVEAATILLGPLVTVKSLTKAD